MDLWAGTPALNILATLRLRGRQPVDPHRIAVMCSPALGDTLLFSGALQDLRAALPEAHITHVCMPQNVAAAEIIPGADERLVVDLTRPAATVSSLRRLQADVFLDFTSWQRLTASYTLLSGARYTVGFHTPVNTAAEGTIMRFYIGPTGTRLRTFARCWWTPDFRWRGGGLMAQRSWFPQIAWARSRANQT